MLPLVEWLLIVPTFLVAIVEGDATEVVAWRQGVAYTAPVRNGRAVVGPMPRGAYRVYARGGGVMSAPVARVLTAPAPYDAGHDVVLTCRRAHKVTVLTTDGAVLRWRGIDWPTTTMLPEGLHRIVVDHAERVSSAERLVRVDGPTTLDVPLDAGLVVTGEVLDASGQPVAGARVTLFGDGYDRQRGTWSDADGSFGVAGISSDVVTVAVRAQGYAVARRRVWFPAGRQQARVTVVLRPGSQAVARVTDEHGRPLPTAKITLLARWYEDVLEQPRLRANAQPPTRRGARMRFAGLVPGRTYRLLVAAPGYGPAASASFVAPAPGHVTDVGTISLKRGHTLTAVPPSGSGAEVLCVGAGGVLRHRLGRTGAVRFAGLDAGSYRLSASARPDQVIEAEVSRDTTKRWEADARDERPLTGEVVDADGKPLPGVLVRVLETTTITDANGAFSIAGLPRSIDRWSVALEPGPGCRALARDPHLPKLERKVAAGSRVRVRLERAGALWLRFSGPRLARARVELAGTTNNLRRRQRVARGAREVFVFDLPVGGYVVGVRAPGIASPPQEILEVTPRPAQATELTVTPGRRVSGVVSVRTEGSAAVLSVRDTRAERGWVMLVDGHSLSSLALVAIDADGSYRLSGLPARPVILAATAPGLPPTWVRVDLTQGDQEGVQIALKASAEAAVSILGTKDEPLTGARVRFRTEFGLDVFDFVAFARFRHIVAGDRDVDEFGPLLRMYKHGARFSIRQAPGSYRVDVAADGYKSVRVGVRARTKASLGPVGSIPELPKDWASPVRLVPDRR